ncbi:MAG: JAB domain-containing protein [Burkholderiaceae bacterium]|nr:MAG: JAB domain-containing protein [Burkholderiaceae bacterium]
MSIRDWPEGERPREKLIALGPQALSEAELLAVFLRTGIVGKSAVDIARDCLRQFGGLNDFLAAPLKEFSKIPGLGSAKFAQLQAVLELARRTVREDLKRNSTLSSPRQVRDLLALQLRQRPYEVFLALFLDAQNRLISCEELFRGTLTQTSVYPREVVKHALAVNAAGVMFAHNHPSGVAEPSRADHSLTDHLTRALALVDIRVLDHFIVAGDAFYSFAERGQLQP